MTPIRYAQVRGDVNHQAIKHRETHLRGRVFRRFDEERFTRYRMSANGAAGDLDVRGRHVPLQPTFRAQRFDERMS